MEPGTEVIYFDDGIRRLGRVETVAGDMATVQLASDDGPREVWVEQLQPVVEARRAQGQPATRVYRVAGGMAHVEAGGAVE